MMGDRQSGLCVIAPTSEDTESCGAALAPLVKPGDTVLLSGDLGTGKTTFTQGLARALGVEGPVTSPTFVLVHSYHTKAGWDLLHADVWRVEQLQEVVDLAIPELVEEGAAAVIEWGERAAPALARDCLHVTIEFADASAATPPAPGAGASPVGPGGPRRLQFRAEGPNWQERVRQLSDRLAKGS